MSRNYVVHVNNRAHRLAKQEAARLHITLKEYVSLLVLRAIDGDPHAARMLQALEK